MVETEGKQASLLGLGLFVFKSLRRRRRRRPHTHARNTWRIMHFPSYLEEKKCLFIQHTQSIYKCHTRGGVITHKWVSTQGQATSSSAQDSSNCTRGLKKVLPKRSSLLQSKRFTGKRDDFQRRSCPKRQKGGRIFSPPPLLLQGIVLPE